MIIIINKATKEIINNMGTNSAFPDGDIPNVTCKENEEIVRLHDDSELVKKILNTRYRYKLNDTLDDIIITETQEEIDEKERQKQINEIKKELKQLDLEIPRIVEDMLKHSAFNGFMLSERKQEIIDRKEFLRNQL